MVASLACMLCGCGLGVATSRFLQHRTALADVAPTSGAAKPAPQQPLQAYPEVTAAHELVTEVGSAAAAGIAEPCMVLWNFTVADMVSYGFGASLKQLEFMRVWASRHGCSMPVGREFSEDWSSWDLGGFWDSIVSDAEWGQRWSEAQPCGYLNSDLVRCSSSNPVLTAVTWDFEDLHCDQAFVDNMLQTFSSRLSSVYQKPFNAPYAGVHIRHGDKAIESEIFPFKAHMDQLTTRWPDMRNVFFATDDATVISHRVEAFELKGFNVTWTKDERRWKGGSPQTALAYHPGHHDNNDAAIAALLADLTALATASVLVGSYTSNFFRVAWFLNLGLRSTTRRSSWCYDLFVNASCDSWHGQVMAFCRKRAEEGACDLPRMQDWCGETSAVPT